MFYNTQSLFDEGGEEEDLDGESSDDSSSDGEGEGVLGEDTDRAQGGFRGQEVTQSKKTEGTIFGVAGGMGIMVIAPLSHIIYTYYHSHSHTPDTHIYTHLALTFTNSNTPTLTSYRETRCSSWSTIGRERPRGTRNTNPCSLLENHPYASRATWCTW